MYAPSSITSYLNWSSLYTCRKTHWLMLIYKNPLRPHSPSPIWDIYCSPTSNILLKVPKVQTSLGRSSLQFPAPSDCTVLSQSLHSKTQSWTLLQSSHNCQCDVLSTFLPFVLLSVPNVCTMICSAIVLLSCVDALLCCLRSLFM
jgi:hypothetical protein